MFLLEDYAGEIEAQNWKPVLEAVQRTGKSALVMRMKDKPLLVVRDPDRGILKGKLGSKLDMLDRGISLYSVKK